ncbi:hypothetical protein JX266_013984 [Neoarthrinium moseri]|nr:hypothetical protein JX266_013984 [Neoarthrinium moseri]
MQKDFKIVSKGFDDLYGQTERISTVATAVTAIEKNRRAVDQNRAVTRLTWLLDTCSQDVLKQLLRTVPPSANQDDCQRTVIEGLGGTGKTQIALEAAYCIRQTHPKTRLLGASRHCSHVRWTTANAPT